MGDIGRRTGTRRRSRWRLCAGFVLALAGVSYGQAAGPEPALALTPAQIAQVAIPSVVMIRTPEGLGSGFFAASGGKIVTNYHVIQGATEATVVTSDRVEHKDVEVIAVDQARDLAVLRIGGAAPKPLPLADSEASKPGERVVAIGNPLGLGDTISDGLLSGSRDVGTLSFLQISAPISPGSSGGPVFNDRGEVIGVSTFLLTGGQNLNFAIPINAVKSMLAQDKGRPVKDFAGPTRHRDIPNYPVSMLNNCPSSQLRSVVGAIGRAIDVGAPLYNEGNFEACYRIYEGAALEVQRSVGQCAGPRRALTEGLAKAEKQSSWSDKAWAMRDAFDGVIAVVVKAANGGGGGESGGEKPERHVPLVPLSAVDECPAEDVASISSAIGSAIDSGAPLYNGGNVEACVRIYEGAISEIDRKFTRCPAARQVLRDGLTKANQLDGWQPKAWALRDSFDGLLNAIAGRQGGRK